MGFGCAWDTQDNFTHVAEHECILRCFVDKLCRAVNYDVQENVCMRIEEPCPVVGVQQHVHYQILAEDPEGGCVQWVATNDWNYPRMVKYNRQINGVAWQGVVRLTNAGETLPGRWNLGDTDAISIQNNTKLATGTFDVLVVNEVCSLVWVYYDAASGKPMPPGAILGGHLADGTPLYVAAVNLSKRRSFLVGYYNHVTRKATCYLSGVHDVQQMSLLTVP